MGEINYKSRNFVIAEVLACASFILNTICVVTAKELYGPVAPVWLPQFGITYWVKTIFAAIGLFYFSKSGVFTNKEVPKYASISTSIILWYSVPGVNCFFSFPFNILFSGGIAATREQGVTFASRIPTQIIWSIPAVIILVDLFRGLIKNYKK